MQIPTWAQALLLAGLALFTASSAAAQITTYGSDTNPQNSLVVLGGIPTLGQGITLGVANTALSPAPPAFAFLSIASAPDPAFPGGTLLPGFGLAGSGATGELLLSAVPPNPLVTLGPQFWAGGATPPASFLLNLPLQPSLAGVTLYVQGSLLDTSAVPAVGLTNPLAITLAAPNYPGLVLLPAGTYMRGSDALAGPPYVSQPNEKPVHQVTLTKPFWIGRFEVTQAEYQALMGHNPSTYVGANRPVEMVSWNDAVAYCNARNAQATGLGQVPPGYQYRLPTEAEWEYACRAGTTTEFHFGADLFCHQARIVNTEHVLPQPQPCGHPPGSAPVGSYGANPWGLRDMHGNVWEWCLDSFVSYSATPKTDPVASGGTMRVVRGGGWASNSSGARSAFRAVQSPGHKTGFIGFRVVLAPIPLATK